MRSAILAMPRSQVAWRRAPSRPPRRCSHPPQATTCSCTRRPLRWPLAACARYCADAGCAQPYEARPCRAEQGRTHSDRFQGGWGLVRGPNPAGWNDSEMNSESLSLRANECVSAPTGSVPGACGYVTNRA